MDNRLLVASLVIFLFSTVAHADPTLVPPERIDSNFGSLASDTISSTSDTAIRFGDTINMKLHPIINLPVPVSDSDAVRKQYVDDNFVKIADDLYLPDDPADSNVEMSSYRIMGLASPTSDSDAATKNYVDQNKNVSGDGYLPDDTATSDVNMGGYSVTNAFGYKFGNGYCVTELSNSIIFDTDCGPGGNDVLNLTGGGKVGISTNLPNHKLDIIGGGIGFNTSEHFIGPANDNGFRGQYVFSDPAIKISADGEETGNPANIYVGKKGDGTDTYTVLQVGDSQNDSSYIDGVDTTPYDTSVANKDYVDQQSFAVSSDSYLPDDPATSDVDMDSNSIIGVRGSSLDSSAASRGQVKSILEKNDKRMAHIPLTEIDDGDTASKQIRIPTSPYDKFKVIRIGLLGDGSSPTPSGAEAQVYNRDQDLVITSTEDQNLRGDPLASASSGQVFVFRIVNNSGSMEDLSAYFEYVYY